MNHIFQSKMFFPMCLLVAVLTVGCGQSKSADSMAFVQWVSEQAIPIENIDSSLSTTKLEFFREAIGPARVVGIGESRHDTREQLLLKSSLIRHLIKDLGFRTLIIEESYPHAESLDRYVTSGEGDLPTVMNNLAGWYLWDTAEMGELIQWVREFNQERQSGEQVRIFGMDITAPALGVQIVLDFLRTAGINTRLDDETLGLELQQGDFWPRTWERYNGLTDERRRKLTKNYEKLIEILKTEQEKIVAVSSEKEYEHLLLLAEIGRRGNALFSTSDRETGGIIREDGMAETALWILNGEMAGERAIIWSHNLHVARSSFRMPGLAEGILKPMGIQLSKELGEAYLAIGGSFGKGSCGPNLPPGERTFTVPSEEVMDGALTKVGQTAFLIDLRKVEQNSGAARWLRQDRQWRAQDAEAWMVPGSAFDLVYFVNEISRSQPTSLALQRFQSLGD